MAKVIVFGTGQWAEGAHFYLTHDSTHEIVAFTVDGDSMKANENRSLPVVPFEEVEKLYPPEQYEMFLLLDLKRTNHFRAEKYYQAKLKGYELISYVSSKATTWLGLDCGENCVVSEGATIQSFAEIGDDIVLGPGSLVSHHSVIRDHVMLAPNAVVLGNRTVQPYCFIGANATVRDEVFLANDTLVGAGVTVVKILLNLNSTKQKRPSRQEFAPTSSEGSWEESGEATLAWNNPKNLPNKLANGEDVRRLNEFWTVTSPPLTVDGRGRGVRTIYRRS